MEPRAIIQMRGVLQVPVARARSPEKKPVSDS